MPDFDSESLYLDLYDDFADSAEYLQADSVNRNFLPAVLIVGALGWCLAAFATGFLNHLGEKTADATTAKITAIFRKKPEPDPQPSGPGPDQIIEVLQYLHPYLPLLRDSDDAERRMQEKWVSAELEKHSFTGPAAQQLAQKVVDRLRQAGSAS